MVKFWIYENHICELQSEEWNEGWLSQLYMQLLQLQKESLKKFRLVQDSGFFIATAKVAYTCVTVMFILHLILHSAVHIYDFHIFKTVISLLKNDTTYNRSRVNSKFCNLI